MKLFESSIDSMAASWSAQVAFVLILAVLLWATGAPMFLNHAKAANLTVVSDTLTQSGNSQLSKHTIRFTNSTSTIAGQTIKVRFDPAGSAFTEAFSTATSTDISFTSNGSPVTVANSCGTNSVVPTGNYNNGTDENLTFLLCPSTTLTAGPIVIGIGTSTRLITNPSGTGSYQITIGGTQDNSGDTWVAVLPNVTLTASVNSSFTFTVAGLATSTSINGILTTITSSTTTLPFGTLASGTPQTLGQALSVTTNSRNGFSVTVQENQPPTSATGATIDLFKDGASTTVPTAWTAPLATLDAPQTYGHLGLTTDDADLSTDTGSASDDFTGSKFAGNMDQPRVIFAHNGPADGVIQNKGAAKVAYRIQISDLQEAGNDYTNTLTYVATPTF